MHYLSIYNSLIKRGQNRLPFIGCHKHRIVPGYQNGTYIEENISYLTQQEHRIVHKLRYRIWKNPADIYAYMWLGGRNPTKFNLTKTHRKNISECKKGKKVSSETKFRMSLARLGKPCSEEIKEKIRKTLMGHEVSDKTKKKLSLIKTGKKLSEKHKERMKGKRYSYGGHSQTLETREKISQASKNMWAKRKLAA